MATAGATPACSATKAAPLAAPSRTQRRGASSRRVGSCPVAALAVACEHTRSGNAEPTRRDGRQEGIVFLVGILLPG